MHYHICQSTLTAVLCVGSDVIVFKFFFALFFLAEEVSNGKVKVSLLLDQFFPVLNRVYGFCEMVKDGQKCPIKKGPVDIGIYTMIPDNAPTVSGRDIRIV